MCQILSGMSTWYGGWVWSLYVHSLIPRPPFNTGGGSGNETSMYNAGNRRVKECYYMWERNTQRLLGTSAARGWWTLTSLLTIKLPSNATGASSDCVLLTACSNESKVECLATTASSNENKLDRLAWVCIKNSTMNTKNEEVMMGNRYSVSLLVTQLPYCWGLLTLTPMICREQKNLSWFDPLPALFSPSSHTWCQSYETQSQSLSVAAERRRTGSRKRLVSFPDPTQQDHEWQTLTLIERTWHSCSYQGLGIR